jgi:hypothetical protein
VVFTIDLRCDHCVKVRAFEQPPCHERHEPSCPEWVCTTCGTALLVDPVLAVLRPVAARADTSRRRARQLAA